ncbi:MAG: head maturation protease, ClpP-related [Saprospiraceae bacterium]
MRTPDAASPDDVEPFKITARVNGKAGEIDIYSEIGFWGVTASGFKAALKDMGAVESLTVNINSPGGDVFDGIAIYNDLVTHKADVTVRVTGMAASAASLIAMAGDRIEMGAASFLMIHNAWTYAAGDHRAMTDVAKVLEKINLKLSAVYSKRSGQDETEIRNLMDAETWLDSGDAIELGMADAVFNDGEPVNASIDLSQFRNVPAALKKRASRPVAKPSKPAPQKADPAILESLRALTRAVAA